MNYGSVKLKLDGEIIGFTKAGYDYVKTTTPEVLVPCTFCGKPRNQVKKMVLADYLCQGNPICICNECVERCVELMGIE